jgi:hypothetical protein
VSDFSEKSAQVSRADPERQFASLFDIPGMDFSSYVAHPALHQIFGCFILIIPAMTQPDNELFQNRMPITVNLFSMRAP